MADQPTDVRVIPNAWAAYGLGCDPVSRAGPTKRAVLVRVPSGWSCPPRTITSSEYLYKAMPEHLRISGWLKARVNEAAVVAFACQRQRHWRPWRRPASLRLTLK